jgi:outer membrane protein assembly factor BamB
MKRLATLTIVVVLLTALVSADVRGASGGDFWPTWRGPDATGAAMTGNPPITWSETENIKWKVKVPGESSSSPIVWADRIFFLTAIETDKPVPSEVEGKVEPAPDANAPQDQPRGRGPMSKPPTSVYKFDVVCMDRKTGGILWQKTAREELPHEGHQENGSFASSSPVTDGKYVWAGFGSRGVHCYDMDGNHKWSRDLGKMRIFGAFGEGSSIALAGDAIIVVMDHEGDSFIYALNKETGETLWQKARDEGTTWATPLPVEVKGKIQIITNAVKFIRSYDLKTGELLWQCSGQAESVIPSPISGFGMVFCMSNFRNDNVLQAIELGHTGDLSGTDAVKWEVKQGTSNISSPLLYGDKIYFSSARQGIISCYRAETGKANFVEQRLEEMVEIFASPVGVADRIYFVSRNGVTKVIKHSDKLQVLATNKLDDRFDASPAVVGDELFLKGKDNIYCIAMP